MGQSGTGRSFARTLRSALFGVAACGAAIAPSTLANGSVGHRTPAKVKPDFGFFAGKTITFVIAAAPGSGGISAAGVALQSPLAAYLHATVNVEYVSNALTADNSVGTAPPDGLTIGVTGVPTVLNNIYSGVNLTSYSLLKASYVGSTGGQPIMAVACPGSPFTSFDQLLKSKQTVVSVQNSSGGSNLISRLLLGAYGAPHKYLTGYTSSTLVPGCQRGDGNWEVNGANNFLTSAGNAITPGFTPLVLTAPFPKGSPAFGLNKSIPTIASYFAKHKPSTPGGQAIVKILVDQFGLGAPGEMVFGAPGIPANRLVALQDAMTAAFKVPSVKTALLLAGLPTNSVSGPAVLSFLKYQIKHQTIVQRYLNEP